MPRKQRAPESFAKGVETRRAGAGYGQSRGHSRPPVSDETRAKLRAALKGRTFSAEWRARLGAAARGREASAETRAKIGASSHERMAGRTVSAATRARIAMAKIGNQAPLGCIRSAETRARMSQAQRKRFAVDAPVRLKPVRRVIGECAYCGGPATDRDHIVPKCRGGSDHPSNIVPACRPCNASKNGLLLEEWLGYRRRHPTPGLPPLLAMWQP